MPAFDSGTSAGSAGVALGRAGLASKRLLSIGMKGSAGAAKAGKTAAAQRAAARTARTPADRRNTGAFEALQKSAGNQAVNRLLEGGKLPRTVAAALGGPSHALEPETRRGMEAQFGFDFSAVRVHEDAGAAASAESLAARAYTVGTDVVFSRGHYRPGTFEGRRLLAHELAHVIQQSRGGAAPDGRAESEAASAGCAAAGGAAVPVAGSAPASIQCQLMDRAAAEQQLKKVQSKMLAKEKEFGETGITCLEVA